MENIYGNLLKEYKNTQVSFISDILNTAMIYRYNQKNKIVIGMRVVRKTNNESMDAVIDRIYIFDGKKNVYYYNETNNELELVENVASILNMPTLTPDERSNFLNSFKLLFGEIVFLSNEKISFLRSRDVIVSFYKHKETKKTTGKVQKEIDRLAALRYKKYKLKDFEVRESYYINDYKNKRGKYVPTSSKLEIVGDNILVLRMFILFKTPIEMFRIYSYDGKSLRCKKNNLGEWVSAARMSDDFYYFFGFYTGDITEEFKNTSVWYLRDLLKHTPHWERCSVQYLAKLLIHSEYEQLYNMGFEKLILDNLTYIILDGINNFMSTSFGYYNPKGKNILAKIGLNSHQVKVIKEKFDTFGYKFSSNIEVIRGIYGEDLSSVDNKSFDEILEMLFSFDEKNISYADLYTLGCIAKNLRLLNKSSKQIFNIIKKLCDLRALCFLAYNDFLKMYIQLDKETLADIDLSFKSFADIMEKHDLVLNIFNSIREKENVEKFKKRFPIWDKWRFEDDKFAIIYPKTSIDLANEGIILHHCVKSYIPNVLSGKTNILFLRKTSEIDVPYFTIEITNEGKIRQIHGLYNCNLPKNSDEYKFLQVWANKNKISLGNINEVLAAR